MGTQVVMSSDPGLTVPLPPVGQKLGFTVEALEEKTSASGKPMLVLKARLDGAEEQGWFPLTHYFVDPVGNRRTAVSLNRFRACLGFPAGQLTWNTDEVIARHGELVLRVKPADEKYPEGRQLDDFVLPTGG